MDAIVERCAGLDVHLDTVVACVLYGKLDIKPKKVLNIKEISQICSKEKNTGHSISSISSLRGTSPKAVL